MNEDYLNNYFNRSEEDIAATTGIDISLDYSPLLSGFSGEIIEAASVEALPAIGQSNTLYVIKQPTCEVWYWDTDTSKYYCVGSDYRNVQIIDGGNAYG